MKQAFTKITTFIIFILLFPYTTTLLTCGLQRGVSEEELVLVDANRMVAARTTIGTIELSMEEYIVGAMASCIDPSYEPAVLEAQAIILRTNLMKHRVDGETILSSDDVIYYDIETRRKAWGNSYEEYNDKFTQAVMNTARMVATVDGNLVWLSYHAVSAGMTRNGNTVLQSESYDHSQSVECQYDITAEEYLQQVMVSRQEIEHMIQRLGGVVSGDITLSIAEVDEAGYVLDLQVGDVMVAGELFRELLDLPSSHFTIESKGDDVLITTKGQGHGVGLSQYGANEMALQGQDFLTILNYFYQTIKIEVGV